MSDLSDYWNGVSLKGQLHTHTTNSDGVDSPAILVAEYKRKGFDFISVTDHDYITPDPNIEGITYIVGVEELAGENPHIVAWDVTDQSASTDVATVINFHVNKGRLVSVTHPNATPYHMTTADVIAHAALGFQCIEVWNNVPYDGQSKWDDVLSAGYRIWGIAVDDCHGIRGNACGVAWVVIHANSNSKADILAALEAGSFYATQGNDIGVKQIDNTIYAASSWYSNFEFVGQNGTVLKTEYNTCRATYDLQGDETYVRVKATRTADNKVAWSQPIFFN